MPGHRTRPQAEPVMVLAGEDQAAHAGRGEAFDPLVGVELRRIEEGGILMPETPFPIGHGVHAEMDEAVELELLPGQLLRRRPNGRGLGNATYEIRSHSITLPHRDLVPLSDGSHRIGRGPAKKRDVLPTD